MALFFVALSAAQSLVFSPRQQVPQAVSSPEFEKALGISRGVEQLRALENAGEGNSLEALNIRERLLERVLDASFDVDSTLVRIDTETVYVSEKRYILEKKSQHRTEVLNLATFATTGALGATGSAMQLTRGLSHWGIALQAAADGSALALAGVQLKSNGGKQVINSPYNMLAQVLDRPPNGASQYPSLILTYIKAPGPDGVSPIDVLRAAWHRLGHLRADPKKSEAQISTLVADNASGAKLDISELTDREDMLHDMHALIAALNAELQRSLRQIEGSQASMIHKGPATR